MLLILIINHGLKLESNERHPFVKVTSYRPSTYMEFSSLRAKLLVSKETVVLCLQADEKHLAIY